MTGRDKRGGYTSLQLGAALRTHSCTSNVLHAITGADHIPPPVFYPSFIIVNSSSDPNISGHWLLIYAESSTSALEFFDSLGQSPGHYSRHIDNYLKVYSSPTFITNTFKIQPSDSVNCGLYCAYVADRRAQGEPFSVVMQHFKSDNLQYNDRLVDRYYREHIRARSPP